MEMRIKEQTYNANMTVFSWLINRRKYACNIHILLILSCVYWHHRHLKTHYFQSAYPNP